MNELPKFQLSFEKKVLIALAVALTVCLVACAPAGEVATFAGNAQKSLQNGTAVFDDLPESVLRHDCFQNVENRAIDFDPPSEACVKAGEQQSLADAKSDRDSLLAVQQSLIDYFSAMQQLAEYGKSSGADQNKAKTDSSNASSAAAKLKSSSSITADEAKSIVGLATLVERVFTAGYRSRQLSKDINEADKQLPIVIGALKHVVQTDYIFDPNNPAGSSLLAREASSMRDVYGNNKEDPLLLKISWTDQLTKLLARNSSAENYVKALDQIEEGHHKLATEPTPLNAKNLASGLHAFTSSLGSLSPKIQKVF